ncbi:hypothetical protein [Egicoccus sp. AB-alg6-2]|uniref:hypothetical protein n=1 Tax=Egicoccus sp. AB-alg6-2 TaxID=3242692 RepID=UPI00359DDBFA
MLPEPALQLAENQLGVIARYQLLQHMDRHRAQHLCRCGYLHPIQRGVYRVRGGAALPDQAPIAAALRARNGQVTGPFVLSRLRVDGFEPDAPFEVLKRPARRLRHVDFAWRGSADYDRPGSHLGDVRLASPVDALVDSGRHRELLGDRKLRLAYDQLRWRKLINADRFADHLDALPADDPGVVGLQQALGLADLRSEAEGERRMGEIMQAFRPAPEAQVWVLAGRRVDWYFRDLKLALEYHGSVDHGWRDRQRADAQREGELAGAGIRVEAFTYADLTPVDDLLARLAGLLTLRARELGTTAPVYMAS